MEVLVLGATGTLGRSVTAEVVRRGHLARAASRTSAHRVDLTTGEGLAQAIAGVDAVIDAANVRSLRRSALDGLLVEGTARVLNACRASGGVHYVGVSIVGIDRVPYAYYRAKLRQEKVIEHGPAPWSLLRATQFHDLLDELFTASARLPAMLLPAAIRLQPIDVADVARRLVDVAEGAPAGRLPEMGGRRVQTVEELAQEWMLARGRGKRVLPIPLPGRVGKALRSGVLCTPQRNVDGLEFSRWLAAATTPPLH